jgi:hypothetical protein
MGTYCTCWNGLRSFALSTRTVTEVHLLDPRCEPGYVIPFVGNLTEGNSRVSMFEFTTGV